MISIRPDRILLVMLLIIIGIPSVSSADLVTPGYKSIGAASIGDIGEYAFFLVLTIIIEFLVVWGFLRQSPMKLLLFVSLINALTWPVAMYAYNDLSLNFWLIESGVTLVESLLFSRVLQLPYSRAFLIAAAANGVTSLLSKVLFY